MKKRFFAFVSLLALGLGGCAFTNVELPTSNQEPFGGMSTMTESSLEEPPPDLSKLYELSCMKINGKIEAVTECGEGLVAAVTVPPGSQKSPAKTLTILDAERDRVLSETTIGASERLICACRSGELLLFDVDKLSAHFYTTDGSAERFVSMTEIPTFFDPDDNLFYYTYNRLDSLDLEGKSSRLLSLAANDSVLAFHPQKQLAVVNCRSGDDQSESGYETILYDLKQKKPLFRVVDESCYSCDFFDDWLISTWFFHESTDDTDTVHRLLSVFSLSENKWLSCSKIDFGTDLTHLNDSGWFAGINTYDDEFPAFQLINVLDGRTIVFDEICNKDEYCACGVESLSCVALGVYDQQKNTSSLYLTDPEQAAATGKLKPFQKPQTSKKPPEATLGEHLQPQRRRADKLEEQYGITILMGNEVKSAPENEVFENISMEDSESFVSDEAQCEATDQMLTLVEHGLGRYSKEFFDHFRDFKREGGLRLLLLDSIQAKKGSFTAGAYTTPNGIWYTICLRADAMMDTESIQNVLNHELWHAVEGRVTDDVSDCFREEDWNLYNADGFAYTDDFEHYDDSESNSAFLLTKSSDKNRVCVIGDYSSVNPKEDRATLAEALQEDDHVNAYPDNPEAPLYASAKEFILHYPLLQKKYHEMKQAVEPVFGKTYPLFWEEETQTE